MGMEGVKKSQKVGNVDPREVLRSRGLEVHVVQYIFTFLPTCGLGK